MRICRLGLLNGQYGETMFSYGQKTIQAPSVVVLFD